MILFNEDCELAMQKLETESVDLVVTSPPYDNIRTYGLSADLFPYEKFCKVAHQIARVLKQGGVCVWIVNDATIKGSETLTSFKQAIYFKETCGLNIHDTMIWQKNSPFTHKNRYIPDFEYMFVISKGVPKTANIIQDRKNKYVGTKVHGTLQQTNDGSRVEINGKSKGREIKEFGSRYNVWDISPDRNNKTGHPAVFPIQLAKDHIITWSNKGDVVLDPFMGSGTTGMACLELEREFIGIELMQDYYEPTKERLNETAILMGAETFEHWI